MLRKAGRKQVKRCGVDELRERRDQERRKHGDLRATALTRYVFEVESMKAAQS